MEIVQEGCEFLKWGRKARSWPLLLPRTSFLSCGFNRRSMMLCYLRGPRNGSGMCSMGRIDATVQRIGRFLSAVA